MTTDTIADALAELRDYDPDHPWTVDDIHLMQHESAYVKVAVATILNAVLSGELMPVQCCMCGKTGLSIAEDGGPECELTDGRWVCSSDCWNKAADDDLMPRSEHLALMAAANEAAAERATEYNNNQNQIRSATSTRPLGLPHFHSVGHAIRALTPADQQAALDRMIQAARQDFVTAVQALGAMPDGYCFCSTNRIGDDSKTHEPECAALRSLLKGNDNARV